MPPYCDTFKGMMHKQQACINLLYFFSKIVTNARPNLRVLHPDTAQPFRFTET